jgi:hypothetical protein
MTLSYAVKLLEAKNGCPRYQLFEGNRVYTFRRQLHRSLEGDRFVALYESPSGRRLCLKSVAHDYGFDETIAVLEVGKNEALNGTIVPASLLVAALGGTEETQTENFYCFVMPYLERVLTLSDGGDARHKVALVLHVAKACNKLYEAGLCYLDLKCENVGWHKGKPLLLDYGSLFRTGSCDGVASYPPPAHPTGIDVLACERNVVWGLGVLLLMLLQGASLRAHFRHLKQNETRCLRTAARSAVDAVQDDALRLLLTALLIEDDATLISAVTALQAHVG